MVLCINAGAKVTLFIGSTTLFSNLLSCEVIIFNKWGVLLLAFPASFLSFIPRSFVSPRRFHRLCPLVLRFSLVDPW